MVGYSDSVETHARNKRYIFRFLANLIFCFQSICDEKSETLSELN